MHFLGETPKEQPLFVNLISLAIFQLLSGENKNQKDNTN